MKTIEERKIEDAQVGDAVTPASLPAEVVQRGGGWIETARGSKYVCAGCHMLNRYRRDATANDTFNGFLCTEIR